MSLRNIWTIFQDFLALAVSLGITAFIIAIERKPLWLTSQGTLSTRQRQIYVTGTTILATLLAGFIVSRVQDILRRLFDHDLESSNHRNPITAQSRKWRTILKVNSLGDAFSHTRIILGYIMLALITPAIVSSITPTVASRDITYAQNIFNGASRINVGSGGDCTYIIPITTARQKKVDTEYFWDLGNGSAYYIPANIGGCPTRSAQILVGAINTQDSGNFAYADGGVAVHRSAIGTPYTLYSPDSILAPEFNSMLSDFNSNALKTVQCAPVMIRNPIRCRRGGTIRLSSSWFNVTSDDGLCQYNRLFSGRNLTVQQTMVKHMCPHGEVGQGTMIIAAIGGYAHWLSFAIDDEEHAPVIPPGGASIASTKYAITCTVDSRGTYEHRNVELNLRAAERFGTRHARYLHSDKTKCSGPKLDMSWYATAAASNWQTLFQNDGVDGWFDLIWEATGDHSHRKPPWAFEDSSNALEDVFGLVAALVGSRFNSSRSYPVNTTVTIAATRVGTSDNLALLYLIPLGFALVYLSTLMVRSYCSKEAKYNSTELADLQKYFGDRISAQKPIEC